MDFNTPAKYQQWDANYGMTAEYRLPEFFMNHPGIAPPPPGFSHHFPSKGRHQRRNKSKHPRFDSCSMHFCRQSYPHEHIFQNDYGNPNLDFGHKKKETGIDYSWNPKGCSRGAYNFSPNSYRFPTYDYASAGCYSEQMCPPKLERAESVTRMSSLFPVEREMKSQTIESHYSRGSRPSKNNNMQRKRKRHFSRERVNVHSANESSSHENMTNGVSSSCSASDNVATAVKYGGQTTLENYDEMFNNETQLAVANLEFCQSDFLGNMEKPCENFQENQISETVTLFADDANASTLTNSEDAPGPFSFSLLNDIFSGIGEVETLENINVCDDKKDTNTLLADGGGLLPCSGSGTDSIETTINLPNDPVTSLIQQNQILIDLLSKIINNSDIFKVANGNKDLGETSTFSEQDQKASEINVSLLPGVIKDDFTFCSESVSSTLEQSTSNSNKETDTMVSINNGTVPCPFRNETKDLYETTDSLINCHNDYEVHKNEMVVRENRLSSDSLNEEFSEVKTHSRSVRHCVLDEGKAICRNVVSVELEDTGSLTGDDHKTNTVIEREETVIRKSSIQKKTVSKMVNDYNVQDLKLCQVMMKSLSGCGSCSSSISCSVKNHTEEERQSTDSEDFNVFSKTRKLRSSMKCDKQHSCLENENSEVNTLEEGENDTLSCSDIHSKGKEIRNEKKVKMTKGIGTSPNTSKTSLTSTKKRSVSRKH